MLADIWQDHKPSIVAIGALIIAALSFGIVVPETEQAVVVRFGEPVRKINAFDPKADFGQTLGKWGTPPGPYLILPFMAPLTFRDGIGYAVDGAMDPLSYVLPFIWERLVMKIIDTVNDRSRNLDLFQGFEETTVDFYSAVRNGYLQRRYRLIHED